MDGHPAAAREVLWVDVIRLDQRIRIHESLCYVSSEEFEATEGPDRIFMGVHDWCAGPDNNPTDDNGHGTHTAGTVGAVGNNGKGVVGVCRVVKLAGLKIGSRNGSILLSAGISAVNYCMESRNSLLTRGPAAR